MTVMSDREKRQVEGRFKACEPWGWKTLSAAPWRQSHSMRPSEKSRRWSRVIQEETGRFRSTLWTCTRLSRNSKERQRRHEVQDYEQKGEASHDSLTIRHLGDDEGGRD